MSYSVAVLNVAIYQSICCIIVTSLLRHAGDNKFDSKEVGDALSNTKNIFINVTLKGTVCQY